MGDSHAAGGGDFQWDPVDARLLELAEQAPQRPAWHQSLIQLSHNSSRLERLQVYRAVRESRLLPDAASFWLVSHLIDEISLTEAASALADFERQLQELEQTFQIDPFCFLEGQGNLHAPPEYLELRESYFRTWDGVFEKTLVAQGETEMALMFRTNRAEYDRLSEVGRRYFFGGDEADHNEWLDRLVEHVADCLTADAPMGPLGYRWADGAEMLLVEVYPTPVELVGGAVDGEIVAPGFSLDLQLLHQGFDEICDLHWNSQGYPYDSGPRLSVEGIFQERMVLLEILAYAPDDEEPGMKIHTSRRKPD